MYFRPCPHCGANLDPGERCDCLGARREAAPLARERPHTKQVGYSVSGRRPEVKGVSAYDRRR